jgi:hypothetical protein
LSEETDNSVLERYLSAVVGISVGSVHNILHKDLNMHYPCQDLVPKMQTPEYKDTLMTLAGDIIFIDDQDVDYLNKHNQMG